MKSRQPTKNRINMHDIIAQPLGALSGAVDAILRRPENLDDVEVQSIFKEVSFIILRAEEALAARDSNAFCALFKLFSEGFAHNEASFEKGIEAFSTNSVLLQTLRGVFRGAVDLRAFPIHSQAIVELLQVIGSLCDGDNIKDICGELFMIELANMLDDMYRRNVEEARANFLTQRAAATALINLVKGSKQNKQRITSWKFLADCCALSVDVFFQLQCVELLFRVSRHNKSLLLHLGSRLRSHILDGIRQLPNDNTLLEKMIGLLSEINENRDDILSFSLNRVDVAHTMISEQTISFFTLNYFIILITSANADNVTIPYKSIRSVTLGKDGRIIFRLDEFPTKLEALLNREAGEDTIVLFMNIDQLNIFKQSTIRSWIVNTLDTKRERRKNGVSENNLTPSSNKETSNDIKNKRHRSESMQLTSGESHLVTAFQNILKTSDNNMDDIFEKMKNLINSKTELKHQETAVILNTTMNDIQKMVDGGRVTSDKYRETIKENIESNIQNIEERLQSSLSKVAVVVEKLNQALQELKTSNTAIHEQMACIEIVLQQTLEVSRSEEVNEYRSLKSEGEEGIGRLEVIFDRQLMGRLNPMNAISEFLQSSIN